MKSSAGARLRARWGGWSAVLLAALLMLEGPVASGRAAQAGPAHPAYYILFVQRADGTIEALSRRQVALSAGLTSLGDARLADLLERPGRDRRPLSVTLRSAAGATLYQGLVEVPQWLRGEFAAEGDSIDGHRLPLREPVFVVRVPALAHATLVLAPPGSGAPAVFDLDRLVAATPEIDLRALGATHTLLVPEGDPANRVDLLVMGDGYTDQQQADFEADAQQVASQFLGITPLAEYANYVNLHFLFTPSDQSGADHPPYDPNCGYDDPSCCGDPAMLSDPLRGQIVDTAFDGRYCAYWIHRLLVTDEVKVLEAAAAVPEWDTILVLVNDATYGGSGGLVATIAMHALAVQIAQHEYGHSFAWLADEYESAYPGYPPCSDIYGPECEANVTDVAVREQIKWAPWIDPTTPIPTPEQSAYDGLVGLFEGARYLPTGMYRSGLNCIMRALGRPFCQVPAQTYVLRLYDGGWGVPAEGIRLVEPGTTYPTGPVTLFHPAQQAFGAEILSPVGGPAAAITWLVDGVPVPGEHNPEFTYVTQAGQLGTHQITLHVRDMTSLVHPDMAGDSLEDGYTWPVEVRSRLFLPAVLGD